MSDTKPAQPNPAQTGWAHQPTAAFEVSAWVGTVAAPLPDRVEAVGSWS